MTVFMEEPDLRRESTLKAIITQSSGTASLKMGHQLCTYTPNSKLLRRSIYF